MAQISTTYSSNPKLRVIKVPRLSAGAFGQESNFSEVDEKLFFGLWIENYWEIWNKWPKIEPHIVPILNCEFDI